MVAGAGEAGAGVLRGAQHGAGEGRLVLEEDRGVEQAGLARVDAGQPRGRDEAEEGDVTAAEHAVDLAAHAGALLDRLQCEGVLVVGAHQLEIADAQGDGVHGEVGGEVLLADGPGGGGGGQGRGGHGEPFVRRGRQDQHAPPDRNFKH